MACFELKSRSDKPRTRSPHAGSSNSQWQLAQTVRPQNEMVGYFNITASLDYDCVVVAGSVHVCKVVILAWDQSILSLPVSPRNESIPQSVPHFTVGQFAWSCRWFFHESIAVKAMWIKHKWLWAHVYTPIPPSLIRIRWQGIADIAPRRAPTFPASVWPVPPTYLFVVAWQDTSLLQSIVHRKR